MTAPVLSTGPSQVDDAPLREDRRRRLFAAMADHGLDALVLGRPAEVAFATGARQLWTAGARPFGPACVAVRATGRTHLLSVSDFDVPVEVGHEDLYGLHWNPANLLAELAAIPGLAAARRVGTTSSSPGVDRLLATAAPDADLVDGTPATWQARLPKHPDEVRRIEAAVDLATGALAALERALRPGTTERHLRATYLAELAARGAPTAPTEAVVAATPVRAPSRPPHLDSTGPIAAGRLVALDPGAFFRGYEGGVGRTRVVGGAPTGAQQELSRRADHVHDRLLDACRPGATGAALRAAWAATGEPPPEVPLVVGIGLGAEPPLVDDRHGTDAALAAGAVLAVSTWVASDGVGGVLRRDLVSLEEAGPRVLTAHVPTDLDGGVR
ncbi:M24 family metallopeptidase [Dermatobacter hominis]|uniref:M24 family metallopeptidase n=1 Tax=Dermatobacter hominis TaxID=2884263 RepID=UPI001D0FFF77|nr:M24 family metallopeptidase [Dermatobacter hominis]UDY35054.1 M24 family metallopeptidase [Dermatobacter hominis]